MGSLIRTLLTKISRLSGAGAILQAMYRRLASAGFVGRTVTDLISWVGSNKERALLVLSTAAMLSVDVFDMFKDEQDRDQLNDALKDLGDDVMQHLYALNQGHFLQLQGPDIVEVAVHDSSVVSAEEASKTLDLKIAEVKQDMETARAILVWAKRFYGSAEAAITAHRIHQAFFEMPHDDVEYGFKNLKV